MPLPPDPSQRANRVLAWMCAIILVTQLGFGSIVPVLPLSAKSFGVSVSAIGMAIAVFGMARFVITMPAAHLSDRLGRRPTLALGALVAGLGNLWCALATHYPEFLVARFVAGAGSSMVLTMGNVILADISPPEKRGRMMATYMAFFLFAFGLGPLPGGWLAEHVHISAPFYGYTVACVVSAALAWFVIPETRHFATEHRGEARPNPPPFFEQLRIMSRKIGFMLVGLISFAAAVTRTGGMFAIVPILASVKLGLGPSDIGIGFGTASILGVLVSYPAGALADRFGRKLVIVPATVLNGAAMILLALAPTAGSFIAACMLWGVASSVAGAAPTTYAADSAPPGMNALALSVYRMLADLGYVIGPMLLGVLADWRNPEFALWTAGLIAISIGLLFARLAPETLPARRA